MSETKQTQSENTEKSGKKGLQIWQAPMREGASRTILHFSANGKGGKGIPFSLSIPLAFIVILKPEEKVKNKNVSYCKKIHC